MKESDSISPDRAREDLPKPRRRLIVAGSAVAAVAAMVGVAALAFGHGGGWRHGGSMKGAARAEHIDHHVTQVLAEIDATDEQEARIKSIMEAAASDLRGMHDRHATGRKELHEILSASTIDRARLEALRSEHILMADQASQRLLAALADSAEVLTPEQRSELGRKMEERHKRRHGEED